jgi:hypothetical protein
VRVTFTHQANVITSISGQQTQANDQNHTTGETDMLMIHVLFESIDQEYSRHQAQRSHCRGQ